MRSTQRTLLARGCPVSVRERRGNASFQSRKQLAMRSIAAMLSSRGPGCTVVELQDEALKAFEDGLLAKEADIRRKLRDNVERIQEVERELVNFRRDTALTSGSKKLGTSHSTRPAVRRPRDPTLDKPVASRFFPPLPSPRVPLHRPRPS